MMAAATSTAVQAFRRRRAVAEPHVAGARPGRR
jgi:hypothetical protein